MSDTYRVRFATRLEWSVKGRSPAHVAEQVLKEAEPYGPVKVYDKKLKRWISYELRADGRAGRIDDE